MVKMQTWEINGMFGLRYFNFNPLFIFPLEQRIVEIEKSPSESVKKQKKCLPCFHSCLQTYLDNFVIRFFVMFVKQLNSTVFLLIFHCLIFLIKLGFSIVFNSWSYKVWNVKTIRIVHTKLNYDYQFFVVYN